MKILLLIASVLLAAHFGEAGFGLRNGGYKGSAQSQSQKSSYLGGSNGNYAGNAKRPATENSLRTGKTETKTSRGLGISAWGIIGIIIGAVLLTTIGYYAFVLYPYMCKKERSYDMIELTDVV